MNDIIAFEVQPLTPYSHHFPIAIKLAISDKFIKNTNKTKKQKQNQNKKDNNRYMWQNNCEENFKVALCQDNIQGLMDTFMVKTFKSADKEVQEFNKIILETAKISLKKKKISKKNNKQKSNTWYDSECRYLKKKLQDTVKKLNCPHNSHRETLRKDYFIVKKKYKKLVKKKHREYTKIKYLKKLKD